MRTIPALAIVTLALSMLAAVPGARASGPELDLDAQQQRLALELQERLERTLLADLALRLERQSARALALPPAAPPARIDPGAPAAEVGDAAPAQPEAGAGPSRMTCRASAGSALECVVVARRPAGAAQLARNP